METSSSKVQNSNYKPGTSLSIATVCFNTSAAELEAMLASLLPAIRRLRQEFDVSSLRLSLIDNSESSESSTALVAALSESLVREQITVDVMAGHGNIGYGRAHNLLLDSLDSDFHLLMNPDVELEESALVEGVRYLFNNPAVALASPQGIDEQGTRLHLCKRYPALLTLLLRGFVPDFIKAFFRGRLARYEMRELQDSDEPQTVPIASGCFMLCRSRDLQAVRGFNPDYFLYFEDFDLSLRLAQRGRLVFLPSMKIIHHGGNAAGKGLHHIRLFMRSAITFFNSHGWRIFSQP